MIATAALAVLALGACGGTFDVTGANSLTVNGAVSGSTSLTKISSGTLVLSSNTNSNSGMSPSTAAP